MDRNPEPDLMNDEAQVAAYAAADFAAPHGQFIEHLQQVFPDAVGCENAVDLGCGPGDITVRLARAFPQLQICGIDGSPCMLEYASARIVAAGLQDRIRLVAAYLPDLGAVTESFDLLISNSLLHHLQDPQSLWSALRRLAKPGARWIVADLLRPASRDAARELVVNYASSEPPILRRDFYNSLLAAYRIDEITSQIRCSGLPNHTVVITTDRHWLAYGHC